MDILQGCPNKIAQQDTTFKPSQDAVCSWKCFGKHPCKGKGHYARHHKQAWIQENPNKVVPFGCFPDSGGGGKSSGKGKGRTGTFRGRAMQFKKKISQIDTGASIHSQFAVFEDGTEMMLTNDQLPEMF